MGLAQTNPLTFDPNFDLSQPQWQLLVQRQMDDLFESSTVATGVEAVDNVTESSEVCCCPPPAFLVFFTTWCIFLVACTPLET